MKDLVIIPLQQENVEPFVPYLLPQVFQLIEEGKQMVLLGACAEGHSLGAMAAAEGNGEMMIYSLYVDKAVRRRGVGTALLEAMAGAFKELHMPVPSARAEYMILEGESAEEIAAFLRRRSFLPPEAGNRLFEVSSRDMRQRPLLKKIFSGDFQADRHVSLFTALTSAQRESIETSDAPYFLKPSQQTRGILKPASVAWVEGDEVMGWMLFRQGFDGEMILAAAYVRPDAPVGCFMRLLEAALYRCYMMLGRDFRCYVSTISDYAAGLVSKLMGNEWKEYENYAASTGNRTPHWLC